LEDLSGLITVFGKQFQDWTSHYSLYAKSRVDAQAIFGEVRRQVEALGESGGKLSVALDDTILRKSGRHIPGTAWRKDPLGPAFQVNLAWAQREVALSAAVVDAMLHVAAIKAYGKGGKPTVIPEAKWRKPDKKIRPSTQDLLNELRRQLWAKAIRKDYLSDFMNRATLHAKPEKCEPNLCSTLFAATA
jgi:hypothetical protein